MAFIAGLFVGAILGVVIMSLCFIARDNENPPIERRH